VVIAPDKIKRKLQVRNVQSINSFPRKFILNLQTKQEDEMRIAVACNYSANNDWIIDVYLNKIHKNTGYKKIAERINNLYLVEVICSIMRCNSEDQTPPCESEEYSKLCSLCPCNYPLERMKIVIN